MASLRKSLAISFAEKYSVFAIQFVSSIVLARLLTPEEIGIYSVGVVIVGFAHMIRDFGITNYLIQEVELTEQKVRSALGLTLLLAWGCALLLFLFRNVLASFYEEAGVREVITILSIGFIFIPFSSTVLALLRRNLMFKQIFYISLASTVINNGTALLLAYLGFGFSSLAWAGLIGTLATVIAAILFSTRDAVFVPSFKLYRGILSFGGYNLGANALMEIGYTAPELIMGKSLGFTAVGYFSRAQGFVGMFDKLIIQAVAPVALPSFSINRRDGGSTANAFIASTSILMGMAWPFSVAIYFLAPDLIQILYGDQWLESISLAKIMVFGLVLVIPGYFSGAALMASGYVRDYFWMAVIVTPIKVTLLLIALPYGLERIVVSVVIGAAISTAISLYVVHLRFSFSVTQFTKEVISSICVALACAIPFILIPYQFGDNEFVARILAALVAVPLWFLAIFGIGHPIAKELRTILGNLPGIGGRPVRK